MERAGSQVLVASRLPFLHVGHECQEATGDLDHLLPLESRARDGHGMYDKEDSSLSPLQSDAPASASHHHENTNLQAESGHGQRLLLVRAILRTKFLVSRIRPLLIQRHAKPKFVPLV